MIYIEGYVDRQCVAPGEVVRLHAASDLAACTVRIVREGDEAEMLPPTRIEPGDHPVPAEAWRVGAGWPACWAFAVPADWPSAAYRLELRGRDDSGLRESTQRCRREAQHDVLLVVRAAEPAATSRILLQLSTNTYLAYNNWGGHSTYAYNSLERRQATEVSALRPGLGYHADSTILNWERQFLRWCHGQGIAVEVATNRELETWPTGFDRYALVLSVGHDEYWSKGMRDNLERFIAAGGNAAFFSGNSVCWQVRLADEGTRMIAYKELYKQDPYLAAGQHDELSTLWSHPLVGRPENRLTGVGFPMGGYHISHGAHMDGPGAYTVTDADHWVYADTGLQDGDSFGGAQTIVGYECDGCAFTMRDGKPVPTGEDGTPASFRILAQCPARWTGMEPAVFQEAQVAAEGMATLGIYTQGGTVFTAGTTDWAHALGHDPIVDRITLNVLNRLGTREGEG